MKEHGHSFQATVVLQGRSGRWTPVRLRIRSSAVQDRVQFAGVGWRTFVLENELQEGHQLLFSLVSKSIFEVHHLDSTASVKKPKELFREEPSTRIIRTSNANSNSHGLDFPPSGSEMSPKPSGEHFAITKNDIVYAKDTLKVKEEVERLVGNLQCPHFVTKISKSSVCEDHSSSLVRSPGLNSDITNLRIP